MANRLVKLVNDEYYHIYNRGNDKRIIFHDDQDKDYFRNLLLVMNDINRVKVRDVSTEENIDLKSQKIITHPIAIGAYCLMPNHFHILIKQNEESGISLFMQKLSTAYVMYYNKKYKRTGGLFEGSFKSKYVSGDVYMKYLFSYIHLNPLKITSSNWKKEGIKNTGHISFLRNYKYSSFSEYLNEEGVFNIINKNSFPDYFPSKDSFLKEINSWISLDID